MSDPFQMLVLIALYVPVTIVINRLQLFLLPSRKALPAQGIITSSALFVMILFLIIGVWLLGSTVFEKVLWMIYLGLVLKCGLLIYVSVMCVSESGRRFYLMALIEQSRGISAGGLQAKYGKEQMLSLRLERLMTWGVLVKLGNAYRLQKRSAYYYSRFFHLWGKLLGFSWF